MQPVVWSVDDRGVGSVVLNRPDVNNAYDRALIMEKGEKRRKEKRSGEREKRNRKVAENRRRRKGKN